MMQTNQELLKQLSVDLRLRGKSPNTQRCYLSYVEKFLKWTGRPAGQLDEKKVTTNTINSYNAAIRFFFAVTLNRTMNYLQMPRFKRKHTLPVMLTVDEIWLLLDSCTNLKHKSFFLLAYGSGLRIGEIARLRVGDIDSQSMRIFVQDGKGGKDRYSILSNECLCVLRQYWLQCRPRHPEGWLFPGVKNVTHICIDSVGCAFDRWMERAGIIKDVSIHSLRNASLASTTLYLHVANTAQQLVSPADRMASHD